MKAEYVDHLGSDLTVVNSARVSFDKESDWMIVGYNEEIDDSGRAIEKHPIKVVSNADASLIFYLALHGHWTPFSHVMITMRETVPIFVARQRFKHMVGFTYNEVSRRYVDDEPEFFTPDVWRSRPDGSVKQGSSSPVDADLQYWMEREYETLLYDAQKLYREAIFQGVAPEQARMVLPQSMMTSYYTTGSLAAFARAYRQRIDSHAQLEIQELATQWGDIIRPLFPVSWEALTE